MSGFLYPLSVRKPLFKRLALAVFPQLAGGGGPQNEIQRFTFSMAPCGGTYTFTLSGHTSGNIAWNANTAAITAALEAVTGIGSGNVSVSGTAVSGPITVTFQGSLANTNIAQMTCDTTALACAAGDPTVTVVQTGISDVAATATVTVNNPGDWSGASGDVTISGYGSNNIGVEIDVTSNDPNTIAANVAASWNASGMPASFFSASAALNIVTLTAVTAGSAGNSIPLISTVDPMFWTLTGPSGGVTGQPFISRITEPMGTNGGSFDVTTPGGALTVAWDCNATALDDTTGSGSGSPGGPYDYTSNTNGPGSISAASNNTSPLLKGGVTCSATTVQQGG